MTDRKTMSHYVSKDHMIADLQDEVGRLRTALERIKCVTGGFDTPDGWRDELLDTVNRWATLALISRHVQAPPKSVAEKHLCLYHFDEDRNDYHCPECGDRRASLRTWTPTKKPAQACEHKGGTDTYQGKPFCKRCGQTVESKPPQGRGKVDKHRL